MNERCSICKRNYARIDGEIMPATWGVFCKPCLRIVMSMARKLLARAERVRRGEV